MGDSIDIDELDDLTETGTEAETGGGDSPSDQTTFEWGTAAKMIEWTLLLFVLLFIICLRTFFYLHNK